MAFLKVIYFKDLGFWTCFIFVEFSVGIQQIDEEKAKQNAQQEYLWKKF